MIAFAVAAAVAVPMIPGGDLSQAAALMAAPGTPSAEAGWSVRAGAGFAWPTPGAPVRLAGNATLVSPPVAVPPEAQALGVRLATGAAFAVIWAEPVDGTAPVALATVAPAGAYAPAAVPVWPVAGRTVRFVVDPVGALGETVGVAGLGPLATALPGWRSTAGVVAVSAPGRPGVVADTPAAVTSPAVDAGAYARALLVRVRGQGTVRARAGGAWIVRRLTSGWRDVRVTIPRRARRAVRLQVRIDPDGGTAHVAALGVVVAQPALAVRAARRGPGVRVQGTVRGCAVHRVTVRVGGTRRTAAVNARGRFRLTLRTGRRDLTVTTVATRLCDPAAATTRVRR